MKRRTFLKLLGLLLIPGIVTGGLTVPLGSNPVYNVTVISWDPFYLYPTIPEGTDHRSSDIYEIRTWQKYTDYTPDFVFNGMPSATKGDWIPHSMSYGGGGTDYNPNIRIRGHDMPFEDGPTSGLDTWGKKFGNRWMMVGVWPGYIGVLPIQLKWIAKNQRTGQEWEILRLNQSGYIDCENMVDGRCVGVPSVNPMPPTNVQLASK